MILFIARDTVKNYTVIFLIIVLGTVASSVIETILGYTSTILSNMIILIVFKILYNIIVTVK